MKYKSNYSFQLVLRKRFNFKSLLPSVPKYMYAFLQCTY